MTLLGSSFLRPSRITPSFVSAVLTADERFIFQSLLVAAGEKKADVLEVPPSIDDPALQSAFCERWLTDGVGGFIGWVLRAHGAPADHLFLRVLDGMLAIDRAIDGAVHPVL